jgi:hypothetical protein
VAKFANETLGTSFSVSDELTVSKQLEYSNTLYFLSDTVIFWRQFKASMVLIEDWESAVVPDLSRIFQSKEADDEPEDAIYLDEATDPRITSLIIWVGRVVGNHVVDLDTVPKN